MRVLLTNDDGIEADGPAGAAPRAAARPRDRARGHRAGRQPLGDGALDHDAPAAVGRGGRLRRRHASATRPTARRSTACASPTLGLDRGLRGRRSSSRASTTAPTSATTSRTRARSRRRSRASCSACRRSPSRSSPRRARWTSASADALRLRRRRRASSRASSRSSTTCRCPPGTLLNINVPAGDAERRRGHAAGQAHLPRRAQARPTRSDGRAPALLDLRRRPRLPRRAGHRPRGRRRRAHRRHAAALRPHRRRRAWTRSSATTSRGCSRPAAREVE